MMGQGWGEEVARALLIGILFCIFVAFVVGFSLGAILWG